LYGNRQNRPKQKKKKLKLSKKNEPGTKLKPKRRKKKKKKKSDIVDAAAQPSSNSSSPAEYSEPFELVPEKVEQSKQNLATQEKSDTQSQGLSSVTSSSSIKSAEVCETSVLNAQDTTSPTIAADLNENTQAVKGKKKKRKRKKKKSSPNGSVAASSQSESNSKIPDDYIFVPDPNNQTDDVATGWATVGKSGKPKVKTNLVTCCSAEESLSFTTHDQNDIPPELELTAEEAYGKGREKDKKSQENDEQNLKTKQVGVGNRNFGDMSTEELEHKLNSVDSQLENLPNFEDHHSSNDEYAICADLPSAKNLNNINNLISCDRQQVFSISSFENIVIPKNKNPKRKRHRLYWAEIATAIGATEYSVQSAAPDFCACFLHALFRKRLGYLEVRFHMEKALEAIQDDPSSFVTHRWDRDSIEGLIDDLKSWRDLPGEMPLPQNLWSPEPLVRAIARVTGDVVLVDAAVTKPELDSSLDLEDVVICELYSNSGGVRALTDRDLPLLGQSTVPLRFIYFPHAKLKHWFYVEFYRGDTLL